MCQTHIVSTASPCFQVVPTLPGASPCSGSPKCRPRVQGHSGPGMCEVPLAKGSGVLVPHRAREDDLGVQVSDDSWTLSRSHYYLRTFPIIPFSHIQPFFPVPQGFTLSCQVSSSKSHWKPTPSRKSSLISYLSRAQNAVGLVLM